MRFSCEFILSHGWGVSSFFWDPLIQQFSSNFSCTCMNRGYFQELSVTPIFSGRREKQVLLSHSYGLYQFKAEQLEAANNLIIFGGFSSFHLLESMANRRSKLQIKGMIKRLRSDPYNQLVDFYINATHPSKNRLIPPDEMNQELLIEDLQQLSKRILHIDAIQKIPNILILHGDKDQIVPLEKAMELQMKIPQAHLTVLNGAGHFLPYTHNQWCAQEIYSFLNEV